MTLLDGWMPHPDVAAAYHTTIRATPTRTYEALLSTDFGQLWLVRVLMSIRAIPALLVSPRDTLRRMRRRRTPVPLKLKLALNQDFAVLEEAPGREIVLGLTGRFWSPSGSLLPTDPVTFRQPAAPGHARAAWNFLVEPVGETHSRLTTETRVRCSDPATTRRFRRYWRLVAPGSGLIRWAILRAVRLQAEGGTA